MEIVSLVSLVLRNIFEKSSLFDYTVTVENYLIDSQPYITGCLSSKEESFEPRNRVSD